MIAFGCITITTIEHGGIHDQPALPVSAVMLRSAALAAAFRRARPHDAARRLAKYGAVGVSGVALITALFWLLHSRLGLHYLPAGALAVEAAICTNYLLNNNWTFRDRRARLISPAGLARYHAVSLGSTAVNLGALLLLAGPLAINPHLANLAGVLLSAACSFVCNVCWTWRADRPMALPAVHLPYPDRDIVGSAPAEIVAPAYARPRSAPAGGD